MGFAIDVSVSYKKCKNNYDMCLSLHLLSLLKVGRFTDNGCGSCVHCTYCGNRQWMWVNPIVVGGYIIRVGNVKRIDYKLVFGC